MTGRLADLFRLAWGLLYWNTRKSWFQLRRGRVACPCQSPSDSGRALETGCEACLHWARPLKFQRVCPLLVNTAEGLRCSADTANVRPFWGRAFAYFGGTAGALYLGGVLTVFAFLRSVGYPISIVHVVWPGSWHRIGEVRGWFFMERSNQAFAAGHPAEGMLYLTNAYEFDPTNYSVGLRFAQKIQLGYPQRADQVYRRLLSEHPEQRGITAQAWFRSLLNRGDFGAIQEVAASQMLQDPDHSSVWLRALIFATRQGAPDTRLRELLASPSPAARQWHQLLQTEVWLRENKLAQAKASLTGPWRDTAPFSLFYQIRELSDMGEGFTAIDLIGKYQDQLDDTARATLLLEAYTALDAQALRKRLVESILSERLNTATVNLLCAYLIRHPDASILNQLFAKISHEQISLADDTLQVFLSLYCTAGVAGDWDKLHLVAGSIRRADGAASLTLGLMESFFRGQTTQTRIATLLPALPMPLEVVYALLERYPGYPRVEKKT